MKSTFFHGTSADNLKSILKNGFQRHSPKLWSASRNEVYLWSPDELVKAGEAEEDWKEVCAKERAYESAQIALSLAKDCRAVVFEIEFDSNLVCEDDSCPNMTGAVCTTQEIGPEQIRRVWISEDLSLMKGVLIGLARRMELFAHSFSEVENRVADALQRAEVYFDPSDFELKPFVLKGRRLVAE